MTGSLTRNQARHMSLNFAEVGVEVSPDRLREISAGAPVTGQEQRHIDFALKLNASGRQREQRMLGADQLHCAQMRRIGGTLAVLVTLNLLLLGVWLAFKAYRHLPVVSPRRRHDDLRPVPAIATRVGITLAGAAITALAATMAFAATATTITVSPDGHTYAITAGHCAPDSGDHVRDTTTGAGGRFVRSIVDPPHSGGADYGLIDFGAHTLALPFIGDNPAAPAHRPPRLGQPICQPAGVFRPELGTPLPDRSRRRRSRRGPA
jgi:hypothetical protein